MADANGVSMNGQPMFGGGPPGRGGRCGPGFGGYQHGSWGPRGFGGPAAGAGPCGPWGRGQFSDWTGAMGGGEAGTDFGCGRGGRGRGRGFGRGRGRHQEGEERRERDSSVSSVSSASSSSSSASSVGSLPDYDELNASQLATTSDYLKTWLKNPELPVSKKALKEAKENIKRDRKHTIPEWLTTALSAVRKEYPDAQFEPVMRYAAINTETDDAVFPPPGTNLPANIQYMHVARLRCLDCPGKLYLPGPGMTIDNFRVHLCNAQHLGRVAQRRGSFLPPSFTSPDAEADAPSADLPPMPSTFPDPKTLRKEIKALTKEWKSLRKQQSRTRKQLRRERRQKRRDEKRERRTTRREMRRAERDFRRSGGRHRPPQGFPFGGPPAPVVPPIRVNVPPVHVGPINVPPIHLPPVHVPPVNIPPIRPFGNSSSARGPAPAGPPWPPMGLGAIFGGWGGNNNTAPPVQGQTEGTIPIGPGTGSAPGAWPTEGVQHRASQQKYKTAADLELQMMKKEMELIKLHEAIALEEDEMRKARGEKGATGDHKLQTSTEHDVLRLETEIEALGRSMTQLKVEADEDFARELAEEEQRRGGY